jgi:hypothetical protein
MWGSTPIVNPEQIEKVKWCVIYIFFQSTTHHYYYDIWLWDQWSSPRALEAVTTFCSRRAGSGVSVDRPQTVQMFIGSWSSISPQQWAMNGWLSSISSAASSRNTRSAPRTWWTRSPPAAGTGRLMAPPLDQGGHAELMAALEATDLLLIGREQMAHA